MSPIEQLNEQLTAEISRAGGGYLSLADLGADEHCQLLVHEGSELGTSPTGTVDWHPWGDRVLPKAELLALLRGWPTFGGPALDPRVGIWFDRYRHQRNKKTGAQRWKEQPTGDDFYPDIIPWDDLERLEADSED